MHSLEITQASLQIVCESVAMREAVHDRIDVIEVAKDRETQKRAWRLA